MLYGSDSTPKYVKLLCFVVKVHYQLNNCTKMGYPTRFEVLSPEQLVHSVYNMIVNTLE